MLADRTEDANQTITKGKAAEERRLKLRSEESANPLRLHSFLWESVNSDVTEGGEARCDLLAARAPGLDSSWVRKFYEFLADHYETFKDAPFVRLESGAYVAPGTPEKPGAYLRPADILSSQNHWFTGLMDTQKLMHGFHTRWCQRISAPKFSPHLDWPPAPSKFRPTLIRPGTAALTTTPSVALTRCAACLAWNMLWQIQRDIAPSGFGIGCLRIRAN